jgi:hypothetical protein
MFLPVVLFAPYVFVQFRTADTAFGSVGLGIIPERVGDYSKEFFPCHVIPEDAHFRVFSMAPIGFHKADHLGIVFLGGFLEFMRKLFMGRKKLVDDRDDHGIVFPFLIII